MSWVESIGANSYTVKRATKSEGPYSAIAKNVKQSSYVDKQVKAGVIYHYTITASNEKAESTNSFETAIAAGLPSPWKQLNIGRTSGITSFDGKIVTIETTGKNLDSSNDELHFTYQPLSNNGEIIARFVPQPSSQFSEMSLMMREGLNDNSRFISLLIYPAKTDQIELPDWRVKMVTRKNGSASADTNSISFSVSQPAVTWGRLTGFVWLRLQRKNNCFVGSVSYDGKTWTNLPDILIQLNKNLLAGITVSSGIPNSTTVFFDKVTIKKSQR